MGGGPGVEPAAELRRARGQAIVYRRDQAAPAITQEARQNRGYDLTLGRPRRVRPLLSQR